MFSSANCVRLLPEQPPLKPSDKCEPHKAKEWLYPIPIVRQCHLSKCLNPGKVEASFVGSLSPFSRSRFRKQFRVSLSSNFLPDFFKPGLQFLLSNSSLLQPLCDRIAQFSEPNLFGNQDDLISEFDDCDGHSRLKMVRFQKILWQKHLPMFAKMRCRYLNAISCCHNLIPSQSNLDDQLANIRSLEQLVKSHRRVLQAVNLV